MPVAITLDSITKRFGEFIAVNDVSLRIEKGQLFFLLGPSGCGKTTLLRTIAGFYEPSTGTLKFDDRNVTRLSPEKRNVGMVFQSYALWPHMTVAENVEFGLKNRKVERAARRDRVERALDLVRMTDQAPKRPGQLSGGQQQRVALARALVVEPDVLLLDEPLSNLDAKLRADMRREIRRLCTQTGITSVYVTHDQDEALSMADAMAVMNRGQLEQVGHPRDVYEHPSTAFVAGFLGPANFLEARIAGHEGDATLLETKAGPLRSTYQIPNNKNDSQVLCMVRPSAFRRADAASANRLEGEHVETMYFGETAQHYIALPGGEVVRYVEMRPRQEPKAGDRITLEVEPADVVVLPA